jgi:hypothetical protein
MKIYRGWRDEKGCFVLVNKKPLSSRLDLWNHSPTGFEWGYGGSGPAQLALAILANHLGVPPRAKPEGNAKAARAVRLHQRFKALMIANIPRDKKQWQITEDEVRHAIMELENEEWVRVAIKKK